MLQSDNTHTHLKDRSVCHRCGPPMVRAAHLLQANGVGLRLTAVTQVEALIELFSQVAVAALAKQGDFGVELHPSLKHILEQTGGGGSGGR